MATVQIDPAHDGNLLALLQEGKPDARGWMIRRIAWVGIATLVVMVLPNLPNSIIRADWVALGMIYVLVGLSVNILIGYAGQVSLGHQAFVGVGAFTSALFVSKVGMPFGVAVIASAATGAVAAILLGLVALRLQGLYLALITLAYGEIAERVIFGIPALTGGGAGSPAPRPTGFGGDRAYAYLCMAFVGLALFVDWRLIRSKAGRAILALRDNEIAAQSVGINTVYYKLFAFVLSGALAGLAGALFAHWSTFVVSVTFNFQLALTFVLMTAVGGLQSRAGIFIGSAFFAIFPLAFNSLQIWVLIIGPVLLLLTLIQFPGGIGEQLRPITEWLNGKPFSFKHDDSGLGSGGAGVRP
ncbi:MAG: branched-chain amino acid ABC transporter permease [Actinomycetota bacterium]